MELVVEYVLKTVRKQLALLKDSKSVSTHLIDLVVIRGNKEYIYIYIVKVPFDELMLKTSICYHRT